MICLPRRLILILKSSDGGQESAVRKAFAVALAIRGKGENQGVGA